MSSLTRTMARWIAAILVVSGIVWLNPLIASPWDGNSDPATCFQICLELSRAQNDVCLLECHMGGYPPEFVPEVCRSYCNQQRRETMTWCAQAVAEGGCSVF